MLISQREACARLGEAGVPGRQARSVLRAGFAGQPTAAGGALLFDERRVDELTRRPDIDLDTEIALVYQGLFVGRRAVRADAPWGEQAADAAPGWDMSPWARIWLTVRMDKNQGRVPFVATVGGFVAMGADLVGVRAYSTPVGDRTRLELQPPADWFAQVRGRRLASGPGKSWLVPAMWRLEI